MLTGRRIVWLMLAAGFLTGCADESAPLESDREPDVSSDAPRASRPSSQPASQPTSRPSARRMQRPAKPLTEEAKIERMIRHVERLSGVIFIRNGQEHDGRDAAKHLRDKWQWKRREIRTARDFIRVAASTSTMSGEAYRIRLGDGQEMKSETYFLELLREIESRPAATSQPITTSPTTSRPTSSPSTRPTMEPAGPAS